MERIPSKKTPIKVSKGQHTLKVKALDDHIIADQWMIKFNQGRKFNVNDLSPKRYEGRYKTVGYSYPKAIIWQDKLFVCYSTNKEDVECTMIPLNRILNY